MEKWIKVSDMLPDTDREVLCVFTGWDDMRFRRTLSYESKSNMWYDWNGIAHDNVTHWVEMPELPKQ